MKLFNTEYLKELSKEAKSSVRLRQHRNLHQNFQEPCQRLFNAIEPGSYIRPHRHKSDPRDELLVAVRGFMALMIFNDEGLVTNVFCFGTEQLGRQCYVAVEIPSSVWHTVIALEEGSVLLEVKAGPFDSGQPKDLASWAPEEGSIDALHYLHTLVECVKAIEISPGYICNQ